MKINRLFIVLTAIALTLIIGCNQRKSQAEPTSSTDAPTNLLPALPAELQYELLEKVDAVDIIMYNLPISMNQDEKNSVIKTVSFMTLEAVPIHPDCKALGRVSFLGNGEPLLDADIFFSADCTYYLIIKDGKPTYSSKMSPAGINFYGNIIQNFQNTVNPQSN